MSEARLIACGKKLHNLKSVKDDLEKQLKAVNAEITELSTQVIPDLMEQLEVPKITIDGIGTLFKRPEVYAYVLAERREDFHTWLREHGHGDLVKETVHPATLKAFAKEQLSEGNPLPEELIKATLIQTAQIRKGK